MLAWRSARNCREATICQPPSAICSLSRTCGHQNLDAARWRGKPGLPHTARPVTVQRTHRQQTVVMSSGIPAAPVFTRDYAKSWCNPSGAVLTPVEENVWGAERPFIWNGIDVGGRGVVIRLSDGTIWTQSPVELTPELRDAINSLGTLKHIVSPNFEHIKFAKQWKEEWPEATMYGCPGLKAKHPELGYDEEVGVDDAAPACWLGEIEVTHMKHESVPIFNVPFFSEVVFFHKPSKMLITTDLFWDYPSKNVPFGTKAWKFGMDQIYLPFYNRLMIGNKAAFKHAMARVFGWGFDAILPCHGSYVPTGGKGKLRNVLATALSANK